MRRDESAEMGFSKAVEVQGECSRTSLHSARMLADLCSPHRTTPPAHFAFAEP
jgi:hypothetical protein